MEVLHTRKENDLRACWLVNAILESFTRTCRYISQRRVQSAATIDVPLFVVHLRLVAESFRACTNRIASNIYF